MREKLFFLKNWTLNNQEKVLVVAGIVLLSAALIYTWTAHPDWLRNHAGLWITIKVALKLSKWIGAALLFWVGSKFFNKENSQ